MRREEEDGQVDGPQSRAHRRNRPLRSRSVAGEGKATRAASRRGRIRLRVAMAIGGTAVAMSSGAAPATTAPEPGVPGEAVGRDGGGRSLPQAFEWLAPSVRVGRNELQIARFRADRAPEDLLASVTAHWSRRPAPIQQTREAGWLIAIQADGEWVETVRIRADEAGAAGLRVRQRLAPNPDERDALALERYLPGARVVNRSQQGGEGRAITTWVLVSQSDPGRLLATARIEGRRSGFAEDPAQARDGGPLWLRRRGEEVVINATPGLEGTVAVVHWSRKP